MLENHLTDLELSSELWGINPELLFIYLSDSDLDTDNLSKAFKLETIRSNTQKEESSCRRGLKWFCEYLGLMEKDQVTPLGKIVLISQNPLKAIQACLFARDEYVHAFFTDAICKDIRSIKRSEFESYFPGEATLYSKLFASFSFATPMKTRMKLNMPLIKETGQILEFSREVEAWLCAKSIFRALLATQDEDLISEAASETLGLLNIPFETDIRPMQVTEAIKHLENIVSETSEKTLTDKKILTQVLEKTIMNYTESNRIIKSHVARLLRDPNPPKSRKSLDIQRLGNTAPHFGIKPKKTKDLVNFLVSLSNRASQVYLPYVEEITGLDMKLLISFLSEVLGEDVEIDSHFVNFKKNYSNEVEVDKVFHGYSKFLFEKHAEVNRKLEILLQSKNYLNQTVSEFYNVVHKNTLVIEDIFLRRVLSRRISPFYFVYTLIDPSDAGKEIMEKYVKNNRLLRREVEKLSQDWAIMKTDNSATYVDMADKLFSKGLETDLPTKEIRIMTPYTDYELQKYVSMLRRLIMKGYAIHIICRHSADPMPWDRLKKGLLEGLGRKTQKVQIRTYTRFKEFLPASKLLKLGPSRRKEFGVHAKIFMIGDAQNGAVLLGSANMLENSFNWNPESGIYTEDPTFIKSVKSFFDFVWTLSKHDALDFSRLGRISKGPFFPHHYYT